MALPPPVLTRQCPEPPFNDTPIGIDRRFSVAWAQYFTDLRDWMESIEDRLTAIGARASTLEAGIADIEARLTAAGL